MSREYFLAPNWSTRPYPDGPIQLGSIIRDLSVLEPLNRTVHTIPEAQLYPADTKTGFEISFSHLHSANLDLKARALGLLGVGANVSIERMKGTSEVLTCQTLLTSTFSPTDAYVREAIEHPDVKPYINGRFRNSVFMITGIKVASGASFKSSTSNSLSVAAKANPVPSGALADVGLTAGYVNKADEGEKSTAQNDVIVAFKVKKMRLSIRGEIKHRNYTHNAEMQSATPTARQVEYDLHLDEELTDKEIKDMFGVEKVSG